MTGSGLRTHAKGASQRPTRPLFLRNVPCSRSQKKLDFSFSQAAFNLLLLFPHSFSTAQSLARGTIYCKLFTYANIGIFFGLILPEFTICTPGPGDSSNVPVENVAYA